MNKLVPLVAAAALFLLNPVQAETPPAPLKFPQEYSVEIVSKVQGQEFASTMYQAKDKTRTETNVQGMSSVSIVRQDQQKMYMLMPMQKMYMEMALNQGGMMQKMPDVGAPKGDVKYEKLGSETVNGVSCDKYKVTVTSEGNANEMIYYIDGEGRPARTEMSHMGQTMTVDYKNWKTGALDASLFEVPAGYSKMPGMGGS